MPKGQKLLQMCPVDKKVEEKLLESCLCSEKESVLTVRTALQKSPGRGLTTRGHEGQEGNLGSGGWKQPYKEQRSGHGSRLTGCLEALAVLPATASASSPPQCLQLAGHLLQLCLNG